MPKKHNIPTSTGLVELALKQVFLGIKLTVVIAFILGIIFGGLVAWLYVK